MSQSSQTRPEGEHHRRSVRLRNYDYSQAGWYFVTICALGRACRFGQVGAGEMRIGREGCVVQSCWRAIPTQNVGVEVDAFVVMPNHVHGIIVLTGDAADRHDAGRYVWTLGEVIRRFKARVTAALRHEGKSIGRPIWQRNYYEHVIRGQAALDGIRRYIDENPARWEFDRENPDVVVRPRGRDESRPYGGTQVGGAIHRASVRRPGEGP